MGRLKLKIKRLETTDIILEAYAKRKSGMVKREALLREEKQKDRVKELELKLKNVEGGWKREKDLKNQSNDLAVEIKNLEDQLSSYDKEVASLHTTFEHPEILHSDRDALRKELAAALKKLVKEKKKLDELLKFGDEMMIEGRRRFGAQLDVERDKLKQLEQNRKKIEKGVYQALKEGLWEKFVSDVVVECAKVKQGEQNSKEMEKEVSLTLKEDLKKKPASDVDVERAKAKHVEQNRKEIEKRAYPPSNQCLGEELSSDVDVEGIKDKQLEQNRKEIMHNFVEPGEEDLFAKDVGQNLAPIPGLPMSIEEDTPFNMVMDDKNATILIGDMIVPLFPKSTLLAAVQAKKHADKP